MNSTLKKKILNLLPILILTTTLQAQDYFSRIFTLDEIVPNPLEMIVLSEDSIIINTLTEINGLRSNTIIAYDIAMDNFTQYDIKGIEPNRRSLLNLEDYYYLFGTNKKGQEDSVVLVKMNKEFSVISEQNYSTPGALKFQSKAFVFDSKIYGTSAYESIAGDDQLTNVKKIDLDGNIEWSKNYFDDLNFKADYKYSISVDGNIINANRISYNFFDRYPQVVKIDTSGNVMWRYDHDESLSLYSRISMVQLSDGDIVLSYSIEGFPYDTKKFIWLDKDGNYLREMELETPMDDRLTIENLQEGAGDYFFANGNYIEEDPDSLNSVEYAFLAKYSNSGEKIWTHKYKHPEHMENHMQYDLIQIKEEENGALVCLAGIYDFSSPTWLTRAWLFRLNAEGCSDLYPCEEYINFSSTEELETELKELKVYPNPAMEVITLELDIKDQKLRLQVYDMQGKRLNDSQITDFKGHTSIDIANYAIGTYLMKIISSKSSVVYKGLFSKL